MSTGESGFGPTVSGRNHNVTINYNYNTTNEKHNFSVKPPSFSGDITQFLWWKSKMYGYIIGVDDELWDIIEDRVTLVVDTE
jgi:hypothetical protein